MKVPFLDIKSQDLPIKNEIFVNIEDVIDSNSFVYGKKLSEFETLFAEKIGVKHCIGVGNGTDALIIALKCLGIKSGDEVITASNTFIATAEAITNVGAKPIFVDNDAYFGIDVDKIEEKISKNTKAIIPVHLYGQSAEMDAIMAICKKYSLFMVEDCSQSHFSKYKGNFTGTFGNAATFSFYPGKNLGAYGDGGCIITNDDNLASLIRMYSNHGSPSKHNHLIEGVNSRLDSLQAAVLSVKLRHIDKWNDQRYRAALQYNKGLENCPFVKIPLLRNDSTHIFHLYVIQAENRDELQKYLSENEIQTGVHYMTALPFLPCYSYLNHSQDNFPVSYKNQDLLLSLPVFPDISNEQIAFVVEKIFEFYSK
jgi:dTDP-4-amino-4,6-dideoxygalactose transaminase